MHNRPVILEYSAVILAIRKIVEDDTGLDCSTVRHDKSTTPGLGEHNIPRLDYAATGWVINTDCGPSLVRSRFGRST